MPGVEMKIILETNHFISLPYRRYIPNLIEIDPVVLLTHDGRRRTTTDANP